MWKRIGFGLYTTLFLLTALFVLLCIQGDLSLRSGPGLKGIRVEGEYSVNGGPFQPLTAESGPDVSDYQDVAVRGHFTQGIPENKQLMLRLGNVVATLKVNGRTIYTNSGRTGGVSRSPGNGWAAVQSPGIAAGDEVELLLANVYRNGNPTTFSQALNEMYVGYEGDLARFTFRQSAHSMLFGFLTVPLGLLIFLTGIVIPQSNRERVFSLALFCFSVGAWILTDPYYMSFLLESPELILAIGQISQFLQLVSITKFVQSIAGGKVKAAVGAIHWAAVLLFAAATLSQLSGALDYYDFTLPFMALCCAVCVSMLWALIAETRKGDGYARKTLLSILPLGAFSLIEQAAWYLGYYYKGLLTQIGFAVFLAVQAYYTVRESKALLYRLERARRVENELIQSRIAIMMSQIQPHFLYNSLMGIKQLCDTEPKKASEALEHFSYFLRGNLDSLSDMSSIPFEQEMVHVQDYLFLEKMRFGEKLKVQTDITETDFMLPPLTLQPIVENAVRYGVTKKKDGGSVTIRSERQGDSVVISILDDGPGFDAKLLENGDRRSHVGIANVKKRLEMQCSGSLTIKSRKGFGTEATITLPQRRGFR